MNDKAAMFASMLIVSSVQHDRQIVCVVDTVVAVVNGSKLGLISD